VKEYTKSELIDLMTKAINNEETVDKETVQPNSLQSNKFAQAKQQGSLFNISIQEQKTQPSPSDPS
jgi:hypothetical protein